MADDLLIAGKTFAADEVNVEGAIKLVARDKIGWGAPGAYNDVDTGHPLPVADAAIEAALATLATAAKQDTLHADLVSIISKLSADPATATGQGTQAAKLDTLHTDLASLATQTTAAAILAALQGTLATAPTSAGDVAGTLTDGRKTVTTPGAAVALRASLSCKWVCATALKTNTDQVNVGGSGVLATAGSSTGQPLAAGESVTIPVNDAAKVFVDARVAGEGVSFTVGT